MVDQLILGDEEVSNWVKKSKTLDSVYRLPGDASSRKYYRVASNGQSYIVMRMEPFTDQGKNLPFLEVQRHLAVSGIDVPKVLEVDSDKGFILLEDLGDITLLRRLQEVSSPDIERHLYERVIDCLVLLQVSASPRNQNGVKKAGKKLEAFQQRFDHAKLMWEVNFTVENFYRLYLKRNISQKDSEIMAEHFSEICTFLADQPTVLTHRDFHSRNVMATSLPDRSGDRLVMIDFQDARMGPHQYDLASLLKDSYYQLEERQISVLIDYYIARYEAASGEKVDRPHFLHVFDLMSIQRNFKAIGSFASFLNRRGDATYLKYIGNTFENIRRTLLKYPRYSKLREMLFHYYYF